ncbi:MAG: hypothetical protein JXR94_15910 [Candidatus Hydrogenedentes bacterium]|nr:hypothetical protein [Candidatus Hydrogenedentota bacterium]
MLLLALMPFGCGKAPAGTLADTREAYLDLLGMRGAGAGQPYFGLVSASGVIPDLPSDSLLDACQIKAKTKDGLDTGFYIVSVEALQEAEDSATYKIAYFAVIREEDGVGLRIPNSMWLTLRRYGDQWGWGQAAYLKAPGIDSEQTQPASDLLMSESDTDSDEHLTRGVLTRAGKTP